MGWLRGNNGQKPRLGDETTAFKTCGVSVRFGPSNSGINIAGHSSHRQDCDVYSRIYQGDVWVAIALYIPSTRIAGTRKSSGSTLAHKRIRIPQRRSLENFDK